MASHYFARFWSATLVHIQFFSGSHYASTVVNLEHHRVNENVVVG